MQRITDIAALQKRATALESRTTAVEAKNDAQGTARGALDTRAATLEASMADLWRIYNESEIPPVPPPGGVVYNVMDYGAVHNGSTDDSTAINNAITAANAAGGGTVYLPAGTYRVAYDGQTNYPSSNSYAASILLKSNVVVKGEGRTVTKIMRAGSGWVSAFGARSVIDNWGLEDLRVDTNAGSSHNGDDGIKMFGATNGHFTNVDIAATAGYEFNTTYMLYGCRNVTFTNCTSTGVAGNIGGFCVAQWDEDAGCRNTQNISFVGCTSTVPADNGLPYGFAIYGRDFGYANPINRMTGITLQNCTVNGAPSGVYMQWCSGPTVIDNNLTSVSGWKYYILNTDNLWFPYPSGAVNKSGGVAVDYTNGGSVTERGSL